MRSGSAQFNVCMASDLGVDITVLPLFDEISQIKWKNPGRYLSSADSGVSTATHGTTITKRNEK